MKTNKNVKSTQQFKYDIRGEEKHYLLMPAEVDQISQYLETFPEKNIYSAFEWLTGKSSVDVFNLRLVVVYL